MSGRRKFYYKIKHCCGLPALAFWLLLLAAHFASCISQYVMVIADGDFAEKVVAVVLPVNAAMVVTLQYSVGRRLNPANIRALMTAGTFCFVIGLVGFIFPATAC